jgi:hypothetical protein
MAFQDAAAGTSMFAELALVRGSAREKGQRLFAAITRRVQNVFDSYRPELHYMRGPGPRWRQKHGITDFEADYAPDYRARNASKPVAAQALRAPSLARNLTNASASSGAPALPIRRRRMFCKAATAPAPDRLV